MSTRHHILLGSVAMLAGCLPVRALDYGLFIKEDPEAWVSGTDGAVAGVAGKGRIADAFRIDSLPVSMEWRACSSNTGWMSWTPADGSEASASGKSLEAIQFRFPAGLPDGKRLYGRVHVEGVGWLKTLLIDQSIVLGATVRAWYIDAIQLRYVEGEVGDNKDLVEMADDYFNRYLPADAIPAVDPVTHPVQIFPDEPGLARWMWMNGKRGDDFWILANGLAHQPTKQAPCERLDTEDYPAYPPTYRLRWSGSEVDTLTINWNGAVLTGGNQNGLPLSAARVDGGNQMRAGQRPSFAIDKKLETLILPRLALDGVTLEEAVRTLWAKSIELDETEKDPTKRGIRFSIRNPNGLELRRVTWNKSNTSLRYAVDQISSRSGTIAITDATGVTLIPKSDR